MIRCFYRNNGQISSDSLAAASDIPPNTIWVDMLSPTSEEVEGIKSRLGIGMPSQEEVWKNQVLNRLYRENGVSYMMAALITKVQSPYPEISPVTFILSKDCLITIRTISPTSFQQCFQRIVRDPQSFTCAPEILEGLLEEILTRVAHNSEVVMSELDALSHLIFNQENKSQDGYNQSRAMQLAIKELGAAADLNSKINESLHSLSRMLNFFKETEGLSPALKNDLIALSTDANVLIKETAFVSDKITFQLDATLGMINVEQNMIIKIFSVVTVFFMPATLVSSLYGMNFKHMPELEWMWGYPYALGLMFMSVMIPFLYFRKRGWL